MVPKWGILDNNGAFGATYTGGYYTAKSPLAIASITLRLPQNPLRPEVPRILK